MLHLNRHESNVYTTLYRTEIYISGTLVLNRRTLVIGELMFLNLHYNQFSHIRSEELLDHVHTKRDKNIM